MIATRRSMLFATGAIGLFGPALLPGSADAAETLDELAERAFIWGFPLVLTGRYHDLALKSGATANRFTVTPTLATPTMHVPGPNIDTLYGFGWLDLAPEPVVLRVPDTHDRYYSIQFMDAYQNVFSYVGRRETGTKAGLYVVTPPGWSGTVPPGATEIKAPTSLVLALTRTLVTSAKDAPEALKVETQYELGRLSTFPEGLQTPIVKDNAINVLPALDLSGVTPSYFDELGSLLKAYPHSPRDSGAIASFAPIGVGPGLHPSSDPRLAPILARAATAGLARIRAARFTTEVNGWSVNYTITNFIADPLARAANALFGPGANISREALYFAALRGPDAQPLNGRTPCKLVFPPGGLPPVDAFWSLILYGADYFLVDNKLDRYGINDRTEGLTYGPGGSLTILIQHDQPAAGTSNWLPAPDGPYKLLFRTYQPRPDLYEGRYKLPALQSA